MADGGVTCTNDTLRQLSDVVSAPPGALPRLLSRLLSPFVEHDALITLAADASGAHRHGAGDPSFVRGVSFLDLDDLRRAELPGGPQRTTLDVAGEQVQVLHVLATNGALLLLARPRADPRGEEITLHLWNTVALRVQELPDAAPPGYLQLARVASRDRLEALTDLTDEYSTTLETVLAALRSSKLDDSSARTAAITIAAGSLIDLRTASDRVRTFTEEPVTNAFKRLQDDLRPLVRYREIDVQFVEPPADGRPLPSEVAHGARAVVRGAILALADADGVGRMRVQWDCDGANLIVDIRDDGLGESSDDSVQMQLLRSRIHALRGRLSVSSTTGWGTQMSVVIPLDPPHVGATPGEWGLSSREAEVLQHLALGERNRDIAEDLGISENTVKFHAAAVYRKLGVAGRAAAAAVYLAAVGVPGDASG
jgi:DNA-binding CsgD family transcriptional regulator